MLLPVAEELIFSSSHITETQTTTKMKVSAAILATLLVGVESFAPTSLPSSSVSSTAAYAGYVPDGMTAAQYKAFKEKEAKKNQRNLGAMGPKGFKSRSFQSFQEALERGEAGHLMPVEFAEDKVRRGELRREDIPYMQRGGSWDNSDVKGARKVRWLSSDKDYASGGFKKEQSVSIFGKGTGLDWTGKSARQGPSESVVGAAPRFGANYKAPNVNDMSGGEKKKKLFGLF